MVKELNWRYIDRKEICHLRGIGKTKQYEDELSGSFPPGERLGMRTVRWRSDVVADWMESESKRAQSASLEIAARQSASAKRGVETRRKRDAATQEVATRA